MLRLKIVEISDTISFKELKVGDEFIYTSPVFKTDKQYKVLYKDDLRAFTVNVKDESECFTVRYNPVTWFALKRVPILMSFADLAIGDVYHRVNEAGIQSIKVGERMSMGFGYNKYGSIFSFPVSILNKVDCIKVGRVENRA